jgi:glycosidase
MTYPFNPDETDWWDTAELNYDNEDMRDEMKEVFRYWVAEYDVDGYRCDVAGGVPCDFWKEVRTALDSIKPVFMLAEDEAHTCLLESAFDMNYAWELHHIFNEVAEGKKTMGDLKDYFVRQDTTYDPDIYRMNFITNHDENSWNGTVFERMGDAAEVMALLTFTVPGMPLLYSGQEIGLDKRLEFFTKDPVEWHKSDWEELYKELIDMKKNNPVLWNGTAGGTMELLDTEETDGIFAFIRANDKQELLVITNLSGASVEFQLPENYSKEEVIDIFTEKEFTNKSMVLGPYGYLVFTLN